MKQQRTRVKGFTLIELLVVLAIVAILGSVAGPPFVRLFADQRAKAAASDLYTALTVARSEAIKRNRNVLLRPKAGDWANGWVIDNPAGGANLLDANAASVPITGGSVSVTYNGGGRLASAITATSPFTIGKSGMTQRCLSVDLSGRPHIKASACG